MFHFSRPVLQQHSTKHGVQDGIPLYEEDTCATIEKRRSEMEEEAVESQSFPAESLNKSTTESDVEVLEKEVQSESYDNISTGTNTKSLGYKETGSMYSLMESKIPSQDERTTKKIEEIVEAIMIQKGTLLDTSEGQISHPQCDIKITKGLPDLDGGEYNAFESIQLRQMRQTLFQSKSTLEKLTQLERAVQQNNFRRQQIDYRNLPLAPFTIRNGRENAEASSSLKHLFHFQCPASENRIITSMAWHNTSQDVLAVGYAGDREHFDQGGLVMFWSLRNPSFPEKRINTSSAVTTIAFSSLSPTILAVGMDDGCISLYDTSHEICSTVFINTGTTLGRHMATVTQLQWVKQHNQTERLLSTSIDGRVLVWSLKQGMSLQPLMTLKRQGGKENELPNIPMIICMDYPKVGNSEFYVAGCEDGTLFVCSRSYTEKHLAEIKGHMSTVTSVKFSPFEEKLFITSSADSTIKLWRYDSKQSSVESVLTIHPSLWAPVNDVVWSPKEPSVFAFVTGDSRIQVWDYEIAKLDPIISITVFEEMELTKIMFGKNASTLVVADEQGTVGVYRVF